MKYRTKDEEINALEQEVSELEQQRDALRRALEGCVASLRGYRNQYGDEQPCDAEKAAAELLATASAASADKGAT